MFSKAGKDKAPKLKFEMDDFIEMSMTAMDRATYSGFLLKAPQGSVGNAKNRFCVLDGNILYYYEREDPETGIGFFLIERAVIMSQSEKDKANEFPFCITTCSARTIVLSAESAEQRDNWVSKLEMASISNKNMQIGKLNKKIADLKLAVQSQRAQAEAEVKQTQEDLLAGLEAAEEQVAQVTQTLQSTLQRVKTTAKEGLVLTKP